LDQHRGRRIVLDEIHRLGNPSELLKIAADHYPDVRIVATGSSSLGASAKFRDTLTDRKNEVWLTPMMSADLNDFSRPSLDHRFLHGGLPPFFLTSVGAESRIQQWVDDYWAKDIQELFRLERRSSFLKFFELLMAASGGLFEATRFAGPCEVSRGTISNYLQVLHDTYVVHVVRPFSAHKPAEILSMPKVYAFDTGFMAYFRGWDTLRPMDRGAFWEHWVLNEIQSRFQTRRIQYWRDKQGHEVDFVTSQPGKPPIAIECKWQARDLSASGLTAFGQRYPGCQAYLVAHDVDRPFQKRVQTLTVNVVGLEGLIEKIGSSVTPGTST
ncbi:MAG: DUF4143 domain-containing protein, partial [Elusimicrobia bacterium]|nr:DUF4143 domain-containing protein [Elusimicrobiota bacterium]